jgi:hypothetical protein
LGRYYILVTAPRVLNVVTSAVTPQKRDGEVSVATVIAGVFANFTNKIDKITEKLEDVDKTKSRGVSCQH